MRLLYGGKCKYELVIRTVVSLVLVILVFTIAKQRLRIRNLERENLKIARKVCECRGRLS